MLCSGFGLGFYIPGILIRNHLRSLDVPARSEVFESLIEESKLSAVDRTRDAYAKDFKVALASQRIPNDIRNNIDSERLRSTLARWHAEDRRSFICLSGHWVHVLDIYRQQRPDVELSVDLLHLDADDSPSWKQVRKLVPNYEAPYRVVQLYDVGAMQINYRVNTSTVPALPFDKRNRRLVVHGGGWGIGTYRDRVAELESAGFALDMVNYGPQVPDPDATSRRRYFSEDPFWRPWHLETGGDCGFPPPGILSTGLDEARISVQSGSHGLYELIRSASAIVSKPGAGTLIDSLGSCTPLVMLEPFGAHEEANANVWSAQGFGISYRDWAAAGYANSILETMHSRLMERKERIAEYVSTLIEDMQEVAQ